MQITSLGFPRIGKNRELKKALEAFWKKEISEKELVEAANRIKLGNYSIQKKLGVDIIPVGDFSFYDSVLDHAVMFNCVGSRFMFDKDMSELERYFVYARGNQGNHALEMTKWFDTNYHYLVPEVSGAFSLGRNYIKDEYLFAKKHLGFEFKPVIIGPYTFSKLCKMDLKAGLPDGLLSVYESALNDIVGAGARYIQIDEPALVYGQDKGLMKQLGDFYKELNRNHPSTHFILQTYFGSIEEHMAAVSDWGFAYIGLDLVRGLKGNLDAIKKGALKKGARCVLGVVDGRNVWAANYKEILSLFKQLSRYVDVKGSLLSPSSSLMFVPYTLEGEDLGRPQGYMRFAYEKIKELKEIKGLFYGKYAKALEANNRLFKDWAKEDFVKDAGLRKVLAKVSAKDLKRNMPFAKRYAIQKKLLGLPLFPTTTIGSFPQTKDVREKRRLFMQGKLSRLGYESFIAEKIKSVVKLQEDIGLDVLVHGEFERTDMVEFFGRLLDGFAFTKNGWVQSYGSRCVRPPIIYGDVKRPRPMTLDEVVFAQELTTRPVKGMLTGPVTILNWSFVRSDIPRKDVAMQIAYSLRQEVLDLEKAGIKIIQVDEPALAEGLPLKAKDRRAYLRWAVDAFRYATAGVRPETQIHTHMCYCDFNSIISAIYEMDADVISIENARSKGELLEVFRDFKYDKGIGPGVYDIHSERVPSKEEMVALLEAILSNGVAKNLLWVNPDCGLKTRGWHEVIESLRNMTAAASEMRKRFSK